MKHLYYLLTLLLVISSSLLAPCVAQQKEGQALIDSLLGQLPKLADDTNKVKMLVDLSFTYYNINPDEGIKYAQQALTLSGKLNWKKGLANANSKLGVNYWAKADYPKALEYYTISLKMNEELGNKHGIVSNLSNIGSIYFNQSDYPKALEYDLKALKMNEELGNKHGVAANLGNIGVLYRRQSDYPKALEYDLKALKINEDLADKTGIVTNFGNIGNVYQEQANYPKALEYDFKSLAVSKELGDKEHTGIALANIGETYLKIVKDSNREIVNNLFRGNRNAALQNSKKYIDSAIVNFKEVKDLQHLQFVYQDMSEVDKLSGDYKGALENQVNYTSTKDSIFNDENRKKMAQVESQRNEYLAQLKANEDKRIAEQKTNEEKHRHNLQLMEIALFIITFLVIVIMLSKVRLNLMAIRFLGILGLLMLFEFINLIIEPIVAESTHDNPFYKLGAMVGIAAIIIPTHHRLEHWIKHWLEKRNASIKPKIKKQKKLITENKK